MKKFFDAGVNLTDKMYKGIYNGKVKHNEDIQNVLQRAVNAGIEKLLILSGSLSDSYEALKISKTCSNLYLTVGCHPTNSKELIDTTDEYLDELKSLATENHQVVAIGECGLDYDRENFAPRDIQKPYFERQIQLAIELQLPLYLHCRAAHEDFISILIRYHHQLPTNRPGIVHTFDGTWEQAEALLGMGLFLGVNGCSLKTVDSLEVVKQIPLDRLILETDAPWCDVRPTHAGHQFVRTFLESRKKERWDPNLLVKGRNEPINIIQIFEIVCGVRKESPEEIAEACYNNAVRLFSRTP